MGEPVPIVLSPMKQSLRGRGGRLPLPDSHAAATSPWITASDPQEYDLRRLPKAEREAARLGRTASGARTTPVPKTGRAQPAPFAPRITVLAAPGINPSPGAVRRVIPGRRHVVHSRIFTVPFLTAFASLLASLGLVLALSLLIIRVPVSTPLQIHLRGAPEAQAQALLATLLHLPQVDSVRFLTKEAQLARARELLPALPEPSLNPFSDTVEVSVASLRSEALLARFLAQPSLRALLDERLPASFASWETLVGERMEELRILRQLASLLAALSLASVLLALSERRPVQLLSS